MKKVFALLCLLVFSLGFLSATSGAGAFDGSYDSYCTLDGDNITACMPASSYVSAKASQLAVLDNSFTVVVSKTIPYPSSWRPMTKQEKICKVYNILLEISSQKGIKYISRTAGYKPKVLFEESYCISDPANTKSAIADPSVSTVPSTMRLFTYQKDNRFGGNVYVVDYTTSKSEVFMNIINCTDMRFMGFPCVEANDLNLYIDAYLTDEGICLTSMATVVDKKPEIKILFYTVDLRGSFERRIEALSDWFEAKVQ